MRGWREGAAALSCIVAIAAGAQQHPALEKGFQPGKAYAVDDLDAVNLFNGNLNVSIPLGQRYQVSSTLSYGFSLSYAGNSWEVESSKRTRTLPDGSIEEYEIAWTEPTFHSNAGVGWLLSFGRIILPTDPHARSSQFVYQAPDGSEQEIDPSIHDRTKVGRIDSDLGSIGYTRDGTFIRYTSDSTRRADGGTNPATWHMLEFPDGTIRTFHADGSISEIEDPYGNKVSITYASNQARPTSAHASCGADSLLKWTIKEGPREHYVYFDTRTKDPSAPKKQPYEQQLCAVDLAAFGNQRAVYQFEYRTRVISRQYVATEALPTADVEKIGSTVTAPLLTAVILPDGTRYAAVYDIGRNETGGLSSSATAAPTLLSDALGGNPGGFTAHLRELTLPTLGKYEWDYTMYRAPAAAIQSRPETRQSHGARVAEIAAGVMNRRKIVNGGTNAWTYTGTLAAGNTPLTAVTTAVDAAGTKTEHYFAACRTECAGVHDEAEYGRPFAREYPESEDSAFARSSRTYLPGDEFRDTYMTYVTGPGITGRKTVYEDGTTTTETYEGFDGLGHFGTTKFEGHDVTRTTTTTYRTDFVNALTDGAYRIPGPSDKWVFGLYKSVLTTETSQGKTSDTTMEYCFDAATAALQRTRSLRSATSNTTDLLAVYTRDSAGNVTGEKYYGGDATPLPADFKTCTATAPATAAYGIGHTYAHGQRKSSQYVGAGFESLDLDIDPNTGLPSTSRDVTDVATAYTFDLMGRLKTVKPAGRAWTNYRYVGATGTSPAGVVATQCSSNLTTCTAGELTEARYYYDGLGRMTQARRRIPRVPDPTPPPENQPATQWATTWTTFDSLGRTKTQSVAVANATADFGNPPQDVKVQSTTYDELGRVKLVTHPDTKTVDFTYSGVSATTRASKAWTSSGEVTVKTRETYDSLGRLVKVIDDAEGTQTLETSYAYGVGGRLTDVNGPRPVGVAKLAARAFQYDGAGLLTSETHPENGRTEYPRYDARGHALEKKPSDCRFHLTSTYDAAERLILVTGKQPLPEGGCNDEIRTLKELLYPSSGSGPLGRLDKSVRYNFGVMGHIKVSESFLYDALGRVEKKTTDVVDVTGGTDQRMQTFSQTFRYDELDQLTKNDYPVCDHVGCGAASHAGTTTAYSNGLVTGITSRSQTMAGGTVATFNHYAGGMRAMVSHGNRVTDTVAADPNGMSRPNGFTYSNFDSSCPAPSVSISPSSIAVVTGATATLTAVVTGDGPFVYQWYQGTSQIPGAIGATYVTPPITAQQTFTVHVTNGCGESMSAPAVVRVASPPPAPSNLVATANSGGTVTVTWNGVAEAERYRVQRRIGSAAFGDLAEPTAQSYTDGNCPAGKTCVYQVRALAASLQSTPSNADLATVMAFTQIVRNVTVVSVAHWNEVLAAVNAMRAAAGAAAVSWPQILPASVSPPASGAPVVAAHVAGLRSAMDAALTMNGATVSPYSDTVTAGTDIRLSHLEQLRERSR